MPVNIDDVETERLVRELVEPTGETLTAATRAAVRGQLERLQAARAQETKTDRILRLGRDIAPRLEAAGVDGDHHRLLHYDDPPR